MKIELWEGPSSVLYIIRMTFFTDGYIGDKKEGRTFFPKVRPSYHYFTLITIFPFAWCVSLSA